MDDDSTRVARIERLVRAEALHSDDPRATVQRLERVCAALVRAVPEVGAGVTLMNATHVAGLAAAVSPVSVVLEELQVTLGEGPSIDAFSSGGRCSRSVPSWGASGPC